MHALKIRKIGNSLGVIIPTEAIHALQVEEGDTLFLAKAPDGYRITPYDPDFVETITVAEKVMRRYRNALRELGK